jgi:hypothetical protein
MRSSSKTNPVPERQRENFVVMEKSDALIGTALKSYRRFR